jgi:superfamily II DNA or RNA helicase
MIKLRKYQENLINKIKIQLLQGKKSICAVLGCGAGKSIIQGMIAKSATDKHNQVLFLVHRKELCKQIENTFTECGVDFDYCQIGMVQTITRRLSKTKDPVIIITDECHHSASASYTRIYDYFKQATRLGFTATPIRMNEGGLGKVYDSLVEGVSTKWLIENNYLSPYKYYSVKLADTLGLHVKRGDFDSKELAALMEQKYIYGDTIKNYVNLANGKKTIIYCTSIKSSIATVEEFQAAGIKAAHIDGTTPDKERKQIIQDFRNGKITVLSNVDLFGEGFDVPDCECVILLRPTKSLALFIQQSMRSMRYKPNKTAIIIDHVGNVFEHGLPDDTREWTLTAKKKKTQSAIHVKQCPVCYACMSTGAKICPECKYVFPKQEIAERKKIDTELGKIDRKTIIAAKPFNYYKKIKTFDGMREFQQAKGYKFGFVLHKCMELNIPIPSKYKYMIERFYK